jgi:hypothetical protein
MHRYYTILVISDRDQVEVGYLLDFDADFMLWATSQ